MVEVGRDVGCAVVRRWQQLTVAVVAGMASMAALGAPAGAAVTIEVPTNVVAVAGVDSVVVSWDAVPADQPVTYAVDDGFGDGCAPAAGATSCVVDGLDPSTSYSFTVTATSGDASSSADAQPVTPLRSTAVPSSVGGLVAGSDGPSVVAAWVPGPVVDDPVASQTVTVLDAQGDVADQATLDPSATSYRSVALTPGSSYTVSVTATNADGPSLAVVSDPVVVAASAPAPAALTGLVAEAGDGSVTVSWDALDPLTAATVTSITVDDGNGHTCTALPTDSSCTIDGLANGQPISLTATVTSDGGATTTPIDGSVTPSAPIGLASVDPSSVVWSWGTDGLVVTFVEPSDLTGISSYLVTDDQGDTCVIPVGTPGDTVSCVLAQVPGATGITVTSQGPEVVHPIAYGGVTAMADGSSAPVPVPVVAFSVRAEHSSVQPSSLEREAHVEHVVASDGPARQTRSSWLATALGALAGLLVVAGVAAVLRSRRSSGAV